MNKAPNKYWVPLIYVALMFATIIAFEPIRQNEFVNYDDYAYVTQNPHVQTGLTNNSIIWAFTAAYSHNWHPLTWLSHMLDCQLFGLNPHRHHLTSLLFHIANTLLLFVVLKNMTGALWQSAFVAAAFALHPLHVESVAWVSERKDVLSTLFWLLTMAAYLRYVKRPNVSGYLLMLFAFALGLMAKPMLVTLPFVLLLLDYWPLGRFQNERAETRNSQGSQWQIFYRLVWEKIPLFGLSVISCIITLLIEAKGAGSSLERLPLKIRIANVPIAYLTYLGKTIWPINLAVFYPHPGNKLAMWQGAVAGLVLVGIFILILRPARNYKYLLVGWLWFVGTLIPVIGLVQVGDQAMADRYTYLPSIGIFIIIAWDIPELVAKWQSRRIILAISAGIVLAGMLICTRTQVRHWQNSFTLLEHAIKVTKDNDRMHYCLGLELQLLGRFDEAIGKFRQALQIKPNFSEAYNGLGTISCTQGKLDEAISYFHQALQINPDLAEAHTNLGSILSVQGKSDEAISQFRQALQINPDLAEAHNNLANVLSTQDKPNEALPHFREALRLKPSWEPMSSLAQILALHQDPNIRDARQAVELAQHAAELTSYQNPSVLSTLATAYAAAGQLDQAVTTAQKALSLATAAQNNNLAAYIRNQIELYRRAKNK